MSLPVELAALRDRLAEYGDSAFLVTVNEDATPHVVSVVVAYENDQLVLSAGRTSRRNAAHNSTLTLVWPPRPDPAYSMIVDGTSADAGDEAGPMTIEPRSAVLHRVAGAPGDGPTCLPLDEATSAPT
jgi:hypothetical protein